MAAYVLALDQGTTSSRALLVDRHGHVRGIAQKPLRQHYPRPGWVEHDPMDIWEGQRDAAREVMAAHGVSSTDIVGIGIANQRETVIVWDRKTGEPVHRAIVWQCRRTADFCAALEKAGHGRPLREKTGLMIDPYFSASKIRWILENVPGAKEKAQRGDLLAGTVDSWLLWCLTKGKVHATDVSNASRTQLLNIRTGEWDEALADLFDVPLGMLPEVRDTAGFMGHTDREWFGAPIPIYGMVGDQQAALFGQACFRPGQAKATYGTGAFLLMTTGDQPVFSPRGMLTTVAWGLNGRLTYAMEGSVFVAGALIQWLRDELELIDSADETEAIASQARDTAGVYVVPAFVGLGAPYWDEDARGGVVGLTRGAAKRHIVRAALEAIAYQVKDVFDVMQQDGGVPLTRLKVDGGAAVNDFLMQFQADMLDIPLSRPQSLESTALGAAYLAGLAAGVWKDTMAIQGLWRGGGEFTPRMDEPTRQRLYAGWQRAIQRVMGR